MANPRLSSFLIGLVLVSFFGGIIALSLANFGTNYGVQYNTSEIEIYNKLNELSDEAEDIRDATDIEEKSGILDIIGSYFTSGYKALKITVQSFALFDLMRDEGIKQAHLGQAGEYLKITITAILIILLFVGVIIATLVKNPNL